MGNRHDGLLKRMINPENIYLMRTIPIKVTGNGVYLYLRCPDTSEAIVLVPEEVEVKSLVADKPAVIQSNERMKPNPKKSRPSLENIATRLRKMKVKSELAAIHSIKAMFQFNEACNDQNVKKILSVLKNRNLIKIGPAGRVSFPEIDSPSIEQNPQPL